jgi:hypothetical protein
VLRFSNENSYLNWARNGVLSSAVGVAMYAQEHHRGAQLSGAGESGRTTVVHAARALTALLLLLGLLLLGFGYIGVGSAKYIYYVFRFRHVMELSWASVFGTISHAAWGLAIWLTAIASFLVRAVLGPSARDVALTPTAVLYASITTGERAS